MGDDVVAVVTALAPRIWHLSREKVKKTDKHTSITLFFAINRNDAKNTNLVANVDGVLFDYCKLVKITTNGATKDSTGAAIFEIPHDAVGFLKEKAKQELDDRFHYDFEDYE